MTSRFLFQVDDDGKDARLVVYSIKGQKLRGTDSARYSANQAVSILHNTAIHNSALFPPAFHRPSPNRPGLDCQGERRAENPLRFHCPVLISTPPGLPSNERQFQFPAIFLACPLIQLQISVLPSPKKRASSGLRTVFFFFFACSPQSTLSVHLLSCVRLTRPANSARRPPLPSTHHLIPNLFGSRPLS